VSSIAERVAAGAAFLDEHEPGWWKRIDLPSLDLSDCEDCVLGQLLGCYEDGLTELGLDCEQSIFLGFGESGLLIDECDYDELTTEWKRVITGRRSA
jgi:hypothetical protein